MLKKKISEGRKWARCSDFTHMFAKRHRRVSLWTNEAVAEFICNFLSKKSQVIEGKAPNISDKWDIPELEFSWRRLPETLKTVTVFFFFFKFLV